jgi:hypothetical protein
MDISQSICFLYSKHYQFLWRFKMIFFPIPKIFTITQRFFILIFVHLIITINFLFPIITLFE